MLNFKDSLLPDFLPQVRSGLHIVATPIGNLGDITLRALSILQACDVIFCEDTRISRKLLTVYGISKPLLTYHDHNADSVRPHILQRLQDGQIVVLMSDAGTPLISDPGYKLVRDCQEQGFMVTMAPGPSSVIAGLVLSGQSTHRFLFGGFADAKSFHEFVSLDATLVFFESASRLIATLEKIQQMLPGRMVSVVREITKLFEEVKFGTPQDVRAYYQENPPRGEIVIVVGPPVTAAQIGSEKIIEMLEETLKTHRLKDACMLVSGALGVPKKIVYNLALQLKNE